MDDSEKIKNTSEDLVRRQEQADALREVGLRNPTSAARINNIFTAFGYIGNNHVQVQDSIAKFESVISLIKQNIKDSKGHINFTTSEYVNDKNAVFDIKQKVLSIGTLTTNDMMYVNKIYKRHLSIQSILTGE